ILLGNGNGTFAAAVNYAAGVYPRSVTTGDFNQDGKTDLAVANAGDNNVSILLGNGNGTFAAAVNYAAGVSAVSVTAGDFNADGKTDLAVANGGSSNNVSILLGTGSGTFAAAVNYAAGVIAVSVTAGDFNADGKTDLAVANGVSSNNVSILINHVPSSAKAITGFTIPGQTGATTIDEGAHTVALTMPYGTDVTSLVPTTTITGASVNPASGVAHDFTTPQTYTVTAEDASVQGYTVTVTIAPNPTKNYFWTWYDNIGGDNWVLMANPVNAANPLNMSLMIGGSAMGMSGYSNGVIPAGGHITPKYAGIMDGPVKATSTTGASGIFSQRILWPKGGNSLEEVLATSEANLSDHYCWTWYDEASPGYQDWILIANTNATDVYYGIRIGGIPKETGTIAAGMKVTPHFPGVMGGPVEVTACPIALSLDGSCSTPGIAKVMASQRVLSNGGMAFNEVPGIPNDSLTDHYLWTWYDQTGGAQDWILIANPDTNANGSQNTDDVYYKITIAGTEVERGGPIAPGDKITPTFNGVIGGPVEVKTFKTAVDGPTQRSIASQRVI
ncbi:MAG: FG-GAP repeat domain-containing protein, partial [Thermoleophilia bacterium]